MFAWRADILKEKGWVTSDRKYLMRTVYMKGLGFGSFLTTASFRIWAASAQWRHSAIKVNWNIRPFSQSFPLKCGRACVCLCMCEREGERVCVLLQSMWGSLCESSSFDLLRICRNQSFQAWDHVRFSSFHSVQACGGTHSPTGIGKL